MQLWYCIPASSGLYQHTTYMPNTDYADYTDYRVVSSPKLTLAGVGWLQLSGIHGFKVSGGDFH